MDQNPLSSKLDKVLSKTLILALAASFLLSVFSWGKYVLYPFKLFSTWVHECSHAAVAALLGGTVREITLAPDTSGLTTYQIPNGRFRRAAIASAGYLGSCAMGCLLYFAASNHTLRPSALCLLLGGLMILSSLFWIRGAFGLITVIMMGAAFVWVGYHPSFWQVATFLLPFLAIQTALNSLYDIRVLFSLDSKAKSDARTMESLFWLPSWFWAVLWLLISVLMIAWTVLGPRRFWGWL